MRPLRSPGVRALVVVAFAIGLGIVAWASLSTTDLLDAWHPSPESGYWSDPTTDPLGVGRPHPPAVRGATGDAARGNATRGAAGDAARGDATNEAAEDTGAATGDAADNTVRGATGDTAEDTRAATQAATQAAAEDATDESTQDAEETRTTGLARVWWVLGGIALALLLAVVVVLAIRVIRRRRRAAPPESIRTAPDRALLTDRRAAHQARMLREGSPREAIIATWLDLERLVAAAGVPRRPSETSSELVVRVLDDREVPAAALTDLAALFREARFSTHELTEALRERAAGDLDAVHAALGARGRGAES